MSAPDPIQTFLLEAGDLLSQIEETALDLEQHPADDEAINRMFRAFHTLKGSGAMFGFDAVAAFTHHIETALDRVREGTLAVDRPLLTLILAARDQIQILLDDPDNPSVGRECEQLVAQFKAISGSEPAADPAVPTPKPVADIGTPATWRIVFRPPIGVAANGLDPLSLLDELRSLGSCEVEADPSAVPTLEHLQAEQCHLAWRIALTTDRGLNAIKDVFIFVEDQSQIAIESVGASPPADRDGAASAGADAAVPARTPSKSDPVKTAPAANAHPPRKPLTRDATVRVPSSKLDRLVDLVGELVMNQSRLTQVSARIDDAHLAAPVEAIERLVAELRDSVLGIRMMPIGSTFSRFKRLVHDLSHELGKEIDLVTEGAETELDKTVLDQLGDPLVHLIRNGIDHAIGTPEERIRNGRPRRGTIRLTATHAGSHVVIAIQDDGRGLDAEAIRAKAMEKGLISAETTLSEKEIFNLIFLPGFSTAKQITSVSGRGVGMDVVKKQIDALRGGIQLTSQRGVGTTISLTLPLTLAIIDGLLVELDGDQFILPMSAVTETVELHRAERARKNQRNVVIVRDELIPYLRLRELFDLGGEEPAIEKVVIARHEGHRIGLVVDRVLGSHQTVIRPLGRFYRHIEVCSGSTIIGDGRVALILDVAGLVHHAEKQPAGPDLRAA
jgi:two-component system chemotaxis sensor kinase CheA